MCCMRRCKPERGLENSLMRLLSLEYCVLLAGNGSTSVQDDFTSYHLPDDYPSTRGMAGVGV